LKHFGGRVTSHGLNFCVCGRKGEVVFYADGGRFDTDQRKLVRVLSKLAGGASKAQAVRTPASQPTAQVDGRFVAVVLPVGSSGQGDKSALAAVIDTGPETDPSGQQNPTVSEFVADMLELFAEKFGAMQQAEEQIELVSSELAQTYEELVLLYKISTNMEIVEPDANFLQMAADSLTGIVNVEGIAILQGKAVDDEKRFVLAAGSGLIDIDEGMITVLYNRLLEEMGVGKEALLDSEVDAPFRYDWPKSVRNLIAVPLCGKEKSPAGEGDRPPASKRSTGEPQIIGMLVAVNRIDKPDFDSTDVKLFTSVASECAVFIENNRLFNELKELFIGSLKALTRSIDAKDRYTRGHSERVAFISKWIAERLADTEHLDQEQIHKIYLAGLLHDIGKIGIDETVLCKKGKLSNSERARLRMHPSIGANILGGIKQMREIIPGVLCHHERIDGKGYPHGLKGEKIPLMGRIVGLADCFDAMTSERVYRDAYTIEDTVAEIESRLGTQFDKEISKVFIESDLYHLWDLMQEGLTKAYGADDFSHYGAEAVGTLIR
jgi:HD-GYP domain-containing protein (c-di-GMP phosphodiesterase class II)